MKYTIAWFSGSGNTLRVARELTDQLNRAGLEARLADIARSRIPPAGAHIICFPVYALGPPGVVKSYINTLPQTGGDAWLLCTMGGGAGGALRVAARLLARRRWQVRGGVELLMPNNYPIGRLPEDGGQLVGQALACTREFAQQIVAGEAAPLPGNWLTTAFSALFNAGLNLNRKRAYRSFSADDNCNSCGLCRRVCPTANIVLEGGKPRWGKDCEQCLRCLHTCPRYAISFMRCKQKGRPQYLEPQLDIDAFILR